MAPTIEENQQSSTPASAALQEKALRTLGGLPPFSPIMNKLLASLAGDDVPFARLADLIEKDTVVAGNILHLVNSALYARSGTVNSVRHALSLLGVEKLRNAVLGMSLTRMWSHVRPAASWSMARFNLHSAATAILSDMVAQQVPVNYPEGAFVAGLMHDVGRLLIAVALPDHYELILSHHRSRLEHFRSRGDESVVESEQEVLGFSHPELSAQALAFWKLPEPIQYAVRDHHAPHQNGSDREFPLSRVVEAADRYVQSIGVSILPFGTGCSGADTQAIEELGVGGDRLEALVREFQAEFEAMTPFFR